MASVSIPARRTFSILLAFIVVVAALLTTATAASASNDQHPMIFTMTNASSGGNEIVAFARSETGELTPSGTYATGGTGNGAALGSQGSLVLTENGRWLFAVNAGSDSVSVFRVTPAKLMLTDVVPSGGDMPISVTVHGRMVYVLNGGSENISGFMFQPNGALQPIAGSTRPLSGTGVGPAQVQFTPDGQMLVVTEKMTNKIDVFLVNHDGIASMPVVNDSHGMTPFGFDIRSDGTLVVSEAFGGAPDGSATSSYQITIDGTLQLVSGSVATTETAACWVVVTPNGQFAYVVNAGSGSVSGYAIGSDGALSLLNVDGQTGLTGAGSSPVDAIDAGDGQFLYVLNSGDDSISIFGVNEDGSLTDIGKVTGLAASAVGIAGR